MHSVKYRYVHTSARDETNKRKQCSMFLPMRPCPCKPSGGGWRVGYTTSWSFCHVLLGSSFIVLVSLQLFFPPLFRGWPTQEALQQQSLKGHQLGVDPQRHWRWSGEQAHSRPFSFTQSQDISGLAEGFEKGIAECKLLVTKKFKPFGACMCF